MEKNEGKYVLEVIVDHIEEEIGNIVKNPLYADRGAYSQLLMDDMNNSPVARLSRWGSLITKASLNDLPKERTELVVKRIEKMSEKIGSTRDEDNLILATNKHAMFSYLRDICQFISRAWL